MLALIVFLLLSLGYMTKLVMHAGAVRSEFVHPVSGNFFGTIPISVLLLSAIVEPYGASVARDIWILGVAISLALSFVVISRLLNGQVDVSHAVPAWLIPGVGTLNIAVTGGHMPVAWAAEVNLIAGAVGGMLALLLSALVVSRLVHRDPLAPAMTPSLMILVAPFAVGFLAYSNVAGGVDRFAALLFYFGLFVFAVIAPKVFRAGVKFSLGWWAIGFPMAALVNAALRYAEFRASEPLWWLAIVLLGGLTLVMAGLVVQTIRSIVKGEAFA